MPGYILDNWIQQDIKQTNPCPYVAFFFKDWRESKNNYIIFYTVIRAKNENKAGRGTLRKSVHTGTSDRTVSQPTPGRGKGVKRWHLS